MTMKKVLFFYLVLITLSFYAQEDRKLPEGWDKILLEGKEAYMNLITGEVSTKFPKIAAKKPIRAIEVDPSILHKVETGETLHSIARKYNISVNDIYKLNAHFDYDNIKVGQEIVVGYDKSKEGKFTYEVIEDAFIDPSNNNYHYVKKGETLFSISKKYNLPVSKLKSMNNLTTNTIEISQKLKVK